MKKLALTAAALSLCACATILDGTSQEILINTNPAGADCAIERENVVIARVNPTPAAATVKKTKHDITIRCNKKGYQETTHFLNSGTAGATVGNVIAGGVIGWGIDSAAGADNKYESPVNINLLRK